MALIMNTEKTSLFFCMRVGSLTICERFTSTSLSAIRRHRAEHRAGGAFQQIFGRSENKENAALDAVAQVRRGDDRVQPHADRLQGPLQEPDTAAARDHGPSDHRRRARGYVGAGQSRRLHSGGEWEVSPFERDHIV